jgi:anti-sigma regulatory factor (Ser/Thr protein kinase)
VRVERSFPADPLSVPAARRFATDALGEVPLDVRQSVELMVSELATNGIRHGQTSFELVVEQRADEIRVAITDQGGGTPTMRFPGPDEPTGRGLQIVEMLSERWGVERRRDSGKTVWFTLSAGAVGREDDEMAARRFPSRGQAGPSADPTPGTFLMSYAPAVP